ncbi:hypothetical protein PTKIN_Ptkin06aG0176900 [Pterospermum kingtungense]
MVWSTNMKKQKRMVNLPEDLVLAEIMTRLPPKSILRFRCLSKSWKVSLSSSDFITMHLNRVQQCKYDDMQHLILRSTDDSLQSINYEADPKTASHLDFPSKYSHHNYFPNLGVLGSCNGLLCVALSRKTLILWNPSIKEFKELPLSSPLDDENRDRVGFGVFVDGVLYWRMISLPIDGLFSSWILGFDIAFEKYDIFPRPDGTNDPFNLTLGMIGGSLISVAQNLKEGILEMWKLEKKGDHKQGWMKLVTIKNMHPRRLVPICVMKNGEVLVTYEEIVYSFKSVFSKFELYDPVKGTFRKLKVGGIRRSYQAIPYTESLVSPNLI